jgi:hypothetical protein
MLGNSDVTKSQNVAVKPGEDSSARAMMEYFKPLMTWLEEQNKGRQVGWD